MIINATVTVVASGTPLNDALYNAPAGEVPVMVLDFEEGVYAKDVGGGLNVSTFDTLISGGLVEMDEDGIRRLRCDTGDAPTVNIGNLSLSSATIVVWCQSFDVAGSFERVFQFDDGTENNRITNWYSAGVPPSLLLQMKDGGLQQANFSTNYLLDERAVRMASAWTAGSVASSANGVASETGDGTETIPTVTTLRLGHGSIAGDELQGGIQRVVIYDTRLSDADLATLSTNNLKFVDGDSGLDTNSGLAGFPWKTIDYAANNANPGDTVYIASATTDYLPAVTDDTNSVGGTDINTFTTFCAEPGQEHTAIINGGGNATVPGSGGTYTAGIKFVANSYLRIAGLRIILVTKSTGVKPKGIEILSSQSGPSDPARLIEHIRIANCQTQHTRSSGIYVSGYRLSSHPTSLSTRIDGVRIEGNLVQDHNMLDGGNEGISVGGGSVNVQIKDNTIHQTIKWNRDVAQDDNGDYMQYGIDLKAGVDGAEIVGNTCFDHVKHGIYLDSGRWWVRNVNIHKNICYNHANGMVIDRETGDLNPEHDMSNIDVYNNIIYDNTRGIYVNEHPKDGTNETANPLYVDGGVFSGISIRNNTFAGHTTGSGVKCAIRFDGDANFAAKLANVTVANNLFWDNIDGIDADFASMIDIDDSNIAATSDPFTNYAGKDFTLASGTSDGVGDANGTYAPADDFDGTARPVGAAYDAGAYEYE